jgi:cholest-4-en-3-one 26-monooxygenase
MAVDLLGVDLSDPDSFVESVPYETFTRLRREAPVYWHPEPAGPGFWAVTRYHDVAAVNRDAQTFSSARRGALFPEQPEELLVQHRMMMLNMDPPMHRRYRRLVSKGFTPQIVSRLEDHVRQLANETIDGVCEKGECDFVTAIAGELPLLVIAELLGVPASDRHLVFEWSNRMVGAEDPEYQSTPDAPLQASAELYTYFSRLADKKRDDPGDDLVTALIAAEVDGEHLSQLELDMFFLLLSVAGNETTRNAISHAMLALVDFPDQRAKLIDDPGLMTTAVEEMLRWATPVMHFRRTATTDTEIAGQPVGEGDKVVIWYSSANRDETVFEDPFRFDVERSPNEHIAFGGGGPHFCLGANLARLEMKVLFEELLRRLPDVELAGPVERLRSNFINGIKHIPVSFSPAAPLAG